MGIILMFFGFWAIMLIFLKFADFIDEKFSKPHPKLVAFDKRQNGDKKALDEFYSQYK